MDSLTSQKFLAGTLGRRLASQGCYFKAINATIGTGIASSTTQAVSATSALFLIQNQAPTGSNVFVFPDYLKLLVSAADVAGTSFQYYCSLDNKLRYASGGAQRVTHGAYTFNDGPSNPLRAK